jgi:uncharacterized protein
MAPHYTKHHATALLAILAGLSMGIGAAGPERPIIDAVKAHDTKALRVLLQQHVDVNAGDQDGATPLLWATHLGHLDMATMLLAAGASVTATNQYGVTPLYEASVRGDAALVERLLKAGADPNTVVQAGETPMMAAARTNSVETVKLLAAFGANVNARDTWQGQSALIRALVQGHTPIVRLLVELGADVNTPATPSSLEQRRDQSPKRPGTRFYVGHSTGGLSPLMFAARQGDSQAVQALLDGGAKASINYLNRDGVGALMIAILNGNFDIAGLLLDEGADPNDGSLYQAVEMHNSALLETVGDSSRPRIVPLDNKLDAIELIKRLLARGADPNAVFTKILYIDGERAQPMPNMTPLVRALRAADIPVIELLLAGGADPNLGVLPPPRAPGQPAPPPGTIVGVTPPIVVALQGGDGPQFAGGTGVTGTKVYRFSGKRDPIEATRLCVNAGADVNAANQYGATALHLAAQKGADDLVRFLVDHGAKLDAQDKQGLTPLDFALGKGSLGGGPPAPPPMNGVAPPAPVVHEETAALIRTLMADRPKAAVSPR